MGVAEAAIAALGQNEALADGGKVVDQGLAVLVEDLGADGNLEHHRLAAGAVAVLARPVSASLGLEMLLVAVVDQGVEAIDGFDHDIAATAAIAAVRPAELDELLAPERNATVAAVAGAHIDLGFIEKFHDVLYVGEAGPYGNRGMGLIRLSALISSGQSALRKA